MNDTQLAIFRSLFGGRTDIRGVMDEDTGKIWQEKSPLTMNVLRLHVLGIRRCGVYLLTGNSIMALAVDYDSHDPEPPLQFVRCAASHGLRFHVERSRGKGFHCWVFFSRPVSAAKARRVVKGLLREVGQPDSIEIYPRQSQLEPGRSGNFIWFPWFDLEEAKDAKTLFLNPATLEPYAEQLQYLVAAQRVTDRQLDEVLTQACKRVA